MTLQGAAPDHLARAVRHSMVVIDAEKHSLDWKASEVQNGISELKQRYQGKKTAGASTLISRARSPERILERKARPAELGGAINRDTGKREFVPTNRMKRNKQGELEPAMVRSSQAVQ